MKKALIALMIGLILTGCSLNGKENNSSGKNKEIQISEYKKYTDFLGIKDKVEKFVKEDIDLDSKQEIMVSINVDSGLKTFILREEVNTIKNIGHIESEVYRISEIELIKLKGEKKKFIKAQLTNGANLSGFTLYEIDGNTIRQITSSSSATGAGDDYLVDDDKDGYYEGYVQNRYSYDVLYYEVLRHFKWNGQDFKIHSTDINLNKYPDNPEDLVSEFLKLSILNNYEENCADLSKRLSELIVSKKILSFAKEDEWRQALQMRNVNFDKKENENITNITATMQDESITFTLTRSSGKWQIIDFAQKVKEAGTQQSTTDKS